MQLCISLFTIYDAFFPSSKPENSVDPIVSNLMILILKPITLIHQALLFFTFWTKSSKNKFQNIFQHSIEKPSSEWIWTYKSSNVNYFPPIPYFSPKNKLLHEYFVLEKATSPSWFDPLFGILLYTGFCGHFGSL